MIRKKLLALTIGLFFILISDQKVLAEACIQPRLGCAANPSGVPGINCRDTKDDATGQCVIDDPDNDCDACPSVIPPSQTNPIGNIFGKIKAPDALKGLVAKDPSGAGGISQFLSNLIALIYSLAAVVLIFMLIWGAFDWITSEGDKEKLQAAQRKIINAVIGIILFAAAFAIIQVLGQFTGFEFFQP